MRFPSAVLRLGVAAYQHPRSPAMSSSDLPTPRAQFQQGCLETAAGKAGDGLRALQPVVAEVPAPFWGHARRLKNPSRQWWLPQWWGSTAAEARRTVLSKCSLRLRIIQASIKDVARAVAVAYRASGDWQLKRCRSHLMFRDRPEASVTTPKQRLAGPAPAAPWLLAATSQQQSATTSDAGFKSASSGAGLLTAP